MTNNEQRATSNQQQATSTRQPVIAITMGDPCGIGPEVIVKALDGHNLQAICRPVVIGSAQVLRRAIALTGSDLTVRRIETIRDARSDPYTVDMLDPDNFDPADLTAGQVSAPAGKAAAEWVILAARLALAHEVDALVTAPLNKEAMHLGGYDYIGHTEILADVAHTPKVTTMLASGPLRVVHVTRHMPLARVAALITTERVLETLHITHRGMQAMGFARPRLGVAALNPHGGEGGLLGDEEQTAIGPAVQAAQAEGIDARGPFPADSIFFRAVRGEFDAVVAMYHDQGHIPIKVYGFERSITITLGLPFIRTSVDHGTAFDIAWQGVADPQSMIEAIRVAVAMKTTSKS